MIFIFFIIAGLQCSVIFLPYSTQTQTQSKIDIYILFPTLFSIMLHHKWLDIVPSAIKQDLIAYPFLLLLISHACCGILPYISCSSSAPIPGLHATTWSLLTLPPVDWVVICSHFPFCRLPEAARVTEVMMAEAAASLCPSQYSTLSLLPC